MKKIMTYLAAAAGLLLAASCQPVSTEMDPDYPSDYDISYALGKVLEKDPVNVTGIDVCPYFDFFKTFRFTIHVKGGKMSSFTIENGDVPFYPFNCVEGEEIECRFDGESSPNVLRIKETDEVIAIFDRGECYLPFQLDCEQLNYEYRFREIAE